MYTKLKNYDGSSAHLSFTMFSLSFQTQSLTVAKPQTETVSIETRQQEKKELRRWVRGVQTHNRLRALVAIQQSQSLS